ncbi:hypothetical protein [Planobispora takensis]|uniref:Uncharacterized protein n=1 Tax=Planobispora takensis TaxID=1367882 RepID=A0A8J3WRG5_9ACTN|nr:hypothetical protein [Planobispora takensis]GIH98102.1 hypothetical protein Pta02_01110 [Planobispora takensis]
MTEDLLSAVRSGDRRASLEAIRDRLAAELVEADGKNAASIAKELRATLAELDALPGGEESKLDDLAARRAARRADATGREMA